MSLRLLVDEDSQAHLLVRLLREAGHDVLTANEAGLQGHDDAAVWQRVCSEGRVLLTRNPADFLPFHVAAQSHPGVLAIYQDNDPAKNMSYADIVRALANAEASGVQIVSIKTLSTYFAL